MEHAGQLAEMSAIGCILSDAGQCAESFQILLPEMFQNPSLAQIYRVCQTLRESEKSIDSASVTAMLDEEDARHVLPCEMSGAILAHAGDYAEIVRENWRKRVMAKHFSNLAFQCKEPGTLTKDILADAEMLLGFQREIENSIHKKSAKTMQQCVLSWLNLLHQPPSSLKTGYKHLDAITGGFKRGGLYILAARPGNGKSDMALNLALRMSREYKIVIHSMEMTADECTQRLVSNLTGINERLIADRTLSSEDYDEITRATEILFGKGNIVIDDATALTKADVKSSLLRHRPDMIVIDHLLWMEKELKGRMQEYDGVRKITQFLKSLAKKHNIVILLLDQETREGDNGKPPQMKDLYGGSAVEQDSDGVWFIQVDKSGYEGLISGNDHYPTKHYWPKNRHGGTGMIEMCYQPQYHRFTSVEKNTRL